MTGPSCASTVIGRATGPRPIVLAWIGGARTAAAASRWMVIAMTELDIQPVDEAEGWEVEEDHPLAGIEVTLELEDRTVEGLVGAAELFPGRDRARSCACLRELRCTRRADSQHCSRASPVLTTGWRNPETPLRFKYPPSVVRRQDRLTKQRPENGARSRGIWWHSRPSRSTSSFSAREVKRFPPSGDTLAAGVARRRATLPTPNQCTQYHTQRAGSTDTQPQYAPQEGAT